LLLAVISMTKEVYITTTGRAKTAVIVAFPMIISSIAGGMLVVGRLGGGGSIFLVSHCFAMLLVMFFQFTFR
jgi:hypothetical protein